MQTKHKIAAFKFLALVFDKKSLAVTLWVLAGLAAAHGYSQTLYTVALLAGAIVAEWLVIYKVLELLPLWRMFVPRFKAIWRRRYPRAA